jgi:hypothetical protein
MILNIKASYFLTGILPAAHMGAMVLMAVIPAAWWLRVVLWAALGWSLYHSLITHAWRSGPMGIQAIELDNEGIVSVRMAGNDAWLTARIISRLVHPWVTLLSLHLESRRWPVNLVIAADAVEPESFRRWRVALRTQALPA